MERDGAMMKTREKLMSAVFLISALTSILAVILICLFLFAKGFPAMAEIGIFKFLLGTKWAPADIPASYGILPMIIGSVYVTAGAIVIGVPIGLLSAVYLAQDCPKRLYRPLKSVLEILAGIPSVVYGFFGMMAIVPHFKNSILSACILLGIMILPTVIGLAESAIKAVPGSYYEGAVALGAGHYRSTFSVMLPAAKSGLLASVTLGIGRAIGETMAVMMVAGNQPRIPTSIFRGVRTMTTNIVLEMAEAADLHFAALVATGVVLFVFILIINLSFSALSRRTSK